MTLKNNKQMHPFCGLDFGTSNSTIGININNTCQLVPLEKNKPTIRSAIFCDNELKKLMFGQEGINHYLEGIPGRLLMALKTVLGSSLMEDKTVIFNEFIPYTKVLTFFLQYIKSMAESVAGSELTQVVMGRPVHFHDNDIMKDQHAQNTLETIARDIGFKEVIFQYEPIAAALAYESTITEEQLALIVDMGGGTSDFTIIRLKPHENLSDRSSDVLANCGIHIAGTNFDQKLSFNKVMPLLGMGSLMKGSSSDIQVPSSYYHDLTTWHTLSNLYGASAVEKIRSIQTVAYEKKLILRLLNVIRNKAGHHILDAVETCKQKLSDQQKMMLNLDFIEKDLETLITQSTFNQVIFDQLQQILGTILETQKIAGIKPNELSSIFYTGGSSKIPIIREKIAAMFPQAEVVQGDAFGSVGMGLTIDAQRKFG